MGVRLAIEAGVARAVGRVSRLAGRGGGTTLPGKLLNRLDPGAIAALAARLDNGTVVISATNGKTTSTAMAAEILGRQHRLAWNHAGANLTSGIASALLDSREADLGLLEVDEFALPAVVDAVRPRVLCLGNLFRDQLDRYGELEHIAERWRALVESLSEAAVVIVNGDDPLVADLAAGRAGGLRFGIDDPAVGRPDLQHAADSKYCIRCGTPYRYTPAYVGHLGAYSCPACGHSRPPLDVVAREIVLDGLDGTRFELWSPAGSAVVELPLPGLYNVYNALAAAATAHALGWEPVAIAEALRGFRAAFGRFERLEAHGRDVILLLVKNPAGANEALRTLVDGGVPPVLLVALNDAIADGRDVSWIWDVDFGELLHRAERVVVSGSRAAELGLRFTYDGFPADRLVVEPQLERALDRAVELTPERARLAVLPTYTAMLELRAIATRRGLTRPYWARGAAA